MIFGYLRCSTLEQGADDRSSMVDQERRVRGAAMMLGCDDTTIIKDIGVSGSVALSDRPAGGVMFSCLQPGDVLVSAKMDRLFRSAQDALETADKLRERGVKLILADMGVEPVNFEGGVSRLFFTLLAAVAEFERWRIRERVSDGRKGKAARGGHIGGDAPYGFRKVGSGRDAMLEPDESEQRVIARAVTNYRTFGSFERVAHIFNRDGVPAREGEWTRAQVRRVVARATAAMGSACAAAGIAPASRSQ